MGQLAGWEILKLDVGVLTYNIDIERAQKQVQKKAKNEQQKQILNNNKKQNNKSTSKAN